MKRKFITPIHQFYTFNISILLVGIMIIGWNLNSTKGETSRYIDNPERTLLVKYGEQVFENEKCSRCHVLNIEEGNKRKKSLDGFGGSRTSTFIIVLLNEPEDVNPGTRMPSFKDLLSSDLDKKVLREALEEENSKIDLELAWKKLNEQAKLMKKNIQSEGYDAHSTSEATALIAFLQSIPRSAAQREIDEAKKKQIKNGNKDEGSSSVKNDKIAQVLAKNNEAISLGKELYANRCAMCHGENGEGMIGPNLTDDYWIYGSSAKEISEIIMIGSPNGMPSSKNVLTTTEIGQVVTYLMEIKGTNASNGKAARGEKD